MQRLDQCRTGFDWEDKKTIRQHTIQLDKRAKNELVQARSKIIDVYVIDFTHSNERTDRGTHSACRGNIQWASG